ncbi:helix-turn-helix transcriptional regulator [Acidiphilium iwatense]|uniref:Helix-turn-helix domain-containing protein n=1 Tax=Acidiphilium iwatense TaxID=768198 RepID=A0ABS9E0T2_9PROT|nr:helix-turn-helix domain-containing protein [Acidiphilium iwatense]MCF3948553.1 helix-turn-helix domain-containing protein [Acidiphilium iwatense]
MPELKIFSATSAATATPSGGGAENCCPSLSSPSELDRRLMPLDTVAEVFGRSRRTVRWWIAEGRLPSVRIGRTPFVPSEAIDRLITAAVGSVLDDQNNSCQISILDNDHE